MGKDLQFALRQLIASPGFTLIAVITLALGIGANTAMFGLLNSLMLKPLPWGDSARLDRIYRATAQNPEGSLSAADVLDLQRDTRGYGEIAAYTYADTSLSEPGQPADMAEGVRVTANFFATLGVQPQVGRDFRAGEDHPGNDRILILSQRCWQKRFGGRTDIIGRTVRVDGEPHEIVGVLPATFNGIALLIAVVGVAGVLAFSVSARTREFGIRLAVGSTPRHLLARVLSEGVQIAAIGIAAGAAGGYLLALVAARFFTTVEMPGTVPVVGATAVLIGAAVVASLMPAARAARVDVVQALRSE